MKPSSSQRLTNAIATIRSASRVVRLLEQHRSTGAATLAAPWDQLSQPQRLMHGNLYQNVYPGPADSVNPPREQQPEGDASWRDSVPLVTMLRDILIQRSRETASRGVEIHQTLHPAEVVVEPTSLHALLQAIVDWALEQSPATLEFRLDIRPWPPGARLKGRMSGQPRAGEGLWNEPKHSPVGTLDSMSWPVAVNLDS